ncbi:MAG: L-serine ammonia-lyase, iron-sulfur-dependent, subunit alpha [Oscillospiraceae bacterium]|nr:L-serine ammonia-lyase, iron-sulfur-dependent, subunit alpha [Oscillospiraceae bacterium]MDD6502014.1 L-serine ammonia-lyase, iron-sulfur-dependent, subunit alpha [Oscillospiraceae bacterium]MDY4105878.1 L-serine ammonia-lyase, iron-sulfur-dependent, subunit alpha [Oscillospiraceae bacterium]
MKYDSLRALVERAEAEQTAISELVIRDEAAELECSCEEVFERMRRNLQVMRESVVSGMERDVRSTSGLTGGDAWKMSQRLDHNITGRIFVSALTKAIAVSETNACMGRIVAAPTAGSCGILPACLLTVLEEQDIPEDTAVRALFTASAVGMVIARNATIAGAEGGCQAECGSASAMAASALVELCGGTPRMAEHACAIALKNVLGLVCDPVAGLVEIPCIKRNAMGTANAFTAAEMALAGIESKIPADEVIWSMKKIGDSMHSDLKETARGGLAATPTGKILTEKVFGKTEE